MMVEISLFAKDFRPPMQWSDFFLIYNKCLPKIVFRSGLPHLMDLGHKRQYVGRLWTSYNTKYFKNRFSPELSCSRR